MRQAGRYLPEYRELRAKAGGFLNLVYDPAMASEITMQPIRRFGMDCAILFSDILVIPQALGQTLTFTTGEGPRLSPALTPDTLDILDGTRIDDTLAPIYETVKQTRQKLDAEGFGDAALIGFAGSPWTVACYMVDGQGGGEFVKTKEFAKHNRAEFLALLDVIIAASIHYLSRQIQSGAQIIQLFDSWAGSLSAPDFHDLSIIPTRTIVRAIKQLHPDIPIIGFPRGVDISLLEQYALETGVDGVGCDESHDLADLKKLQSHACVQGNLDNELLLAGGENMDAAARKIMAALSDGPFIFNLGHGVIKETDPEQVDRLVKLVQEYPS